MTEDKTEIAVAKAEPEQPDASEEKQGSKCCGCFCDYRRAVIVMAILGIVLQAIQIVVHLAYDPNAYDTFAHTSSYWAQLGVEIAFILFYVFQLHAALWFSVGMLACVIVGNLTNFGYLVWANYDYYYGHFQFPGEKAHLEFAAQCVTLVFFCGLTIYPTAGLILEIKKGIMSKETYPREAYSCCCQPKV